MMVPIDRITPIAHRRAVPTVREVLSAARRATGSPLVELEAGTRKGPDGDETVDCTRWAEDSDLFDFEPLSYVLAEARKGRAPAQADLYCRDVDELVTNLTLVTADWTLVDRHYASV